MLSEPGYRAKEKQAARAWAKCVILEANEFRLNVCGFSVFGLTMFALKRVWVKRV